MRFAFYMGWILLLAAFAVAAAETIARTLPGGTGMVLSSAELWRALWPGSYVFAEVRLGQVAPWLWDPALSTLLSVPGWLLFGLPGAILAWTCRPGRVLTPMQEEELREHEASLFLYDELAREAKQWARETGNDPNLDDRLPTHDLIDMVDDGGPEEDYDVSKEPLPSFVRDGDR